jgi:hypothetical protein
LIDVLNGHGVVNETTTIAVYVTTDAKQLPANYDALVSVVKNARLDGDFDGATQRATTVETSFVADTLVTQFNISFRQLIVNT